MQPTDGLVINASKNVMAVIQRGGDASDGGIGRAKTQFDVAGDLVSLLFEVFVSGIQIVMIRMKTVLEGIGREVWLQDDGAAGRAAAGQSAAHLHSAACEIEVQGADPTTHRN